MVSHLHLIASIVIGALLLLAILNLNSTMSARSYEYTLDNLVRETTASIAEILCRDFRRIGAGLPNPATSIISCTSNSIQFLADLDADGTPEQVSYTLSDSTAPSNTPNPRDRYLYRQINNGPQVEIGAGIIDFRLDYYTRQGTPNPTDFTAIRCIEIQLTVESTMACEVDGRPYYARNYWQTKIAPPNLRGTAGG
ncbi:MAG: hypothetical protein ONB05_05520 [candidate division KSB1 bacterium]|nr:hypothetical protein [candidate division KSB1 bacterium]